MLTGLEQHGATAPTVTGTAGTYSATGQSCLTAGCHSTSDLHAIHKDATGCTLAGCHDATKQGIKPTGKSCGTTGTCHTAAEPHAHLVTAHDGSSATLASPGSTFGGSTATGFTDGFESGNTANWTSADYRAASGATAAFNEGFETYATGALTTDANWQSSSTNNRVVSTPVRTGSRAFSLVRTSAGSRQLTSVRTFDTTAGGAAATASFYWRNNASGHTLTLQTSPDGTTWTTAWTSATTSFSTYQSVTNVTLPSSSTLRVRFNWTTTGSAIAYLDDITVGTSGAAVTEAGWSAQTASKQTGTYAARAIGADTTTRYLTKTGINVGTPTSVNAAWALSWSSLEAADSVVVQTYDGSAWTTRKTYTLGGSQAWMTDGVNGLPANTTGIRFAFLGDTADDLLYVDDVSLTPAGGGAGSAGASCQNNPNGTECHNVTDTRTLHSAVANYCANCHTTGGPTNNCQTAGCHVGVNLDEHTATGVGTPAHHENGGNFASFATASECAGCHDDSVAKEHYVLTANTAKPCSVCHATNYTVGTYSPAKATVAAQIAAGTITCNGCHTTSTQTAPHVQRQGTTATLGSHAVRQHVVGSQDLSARWAVR